MITWTPPAPSVALVQTGAGTPQGADLAVDGNHAMYGSVAVAGVAAQNSFVQLFAALNKTVYVDHIRIEGVPAGTVFQVMNDTTAFATNIGLGINKKAGAGGDNSTLNTLSAAANPGTVSGIAEIGEVSVANALLDAIFLPPFELTTALNRGLDIKCTTLNQGFTVFWEYRSY